MKQKILIVTQQFPPDKSGNSSRIYDLAKNLIKLGCRVTVFSPHPSFPHGNFKKNWKIFISKEINGIKHITLFSWQPSTSNPSFLSRMGYYLIFPLHATIWALLKKKEYDVVLTTAPPIFTGITGYFVKKITRKKWFFDVRDLWIDASVGLGFIRKNSLFEKMSRKYEMICYAACDGITVTTEEIQNKIKKNYSIISNKIAIVPNGVDTEIYIPTSQAKKNRIIYTGNIGFAQDLQNVILAVKKVNKEFSLELYLVGDGDIKKDLEELVNKEDLREKIFFTGALAREEIPKLIADSLIGIAPLKNTESLRYAIPTKVYEYMSCGIPFIATGKGEIENVAKKSEGGIIAENTAESIYKQVIRLIENEPLRKNMGKNGREFVKKYYDRKNIAKHLLHNIEMWSHGE
jgi:glycosyltransferase involved in cell wall biosynthesis